MSSPGRRNQYNSGEHDVGGGRSGERTAPVTAAPSMCSVSPPTFGRLATPTILGLQSHESAYLSGARVNDQISKHSRSRCYGGKLGPGDGRPLRGFEGPVLFVPQSAAVPRLLTRILRRSCLSLAEREPGLFHLLHFENRALRLSAEKTPPEAATCPQLCDEVWAAGGRRGRGKPAAVHTCPVGSRTTVVNQGWFFWFFFEL